MIDEPTVMERVYIGYHITPVGSLVGLAWGFVCGTICGGIFAWLYNFLAERIGAGAEHLAKKTDVSEPLFTSTYQKPGFGRLLQESVALWSR